MFLLNATLLSSRFVTTDPHNMVVNHSLYVQVHRQVISPHTTVLQIKFHKIFLLLKVMNNVTKMAVISVKFSWILHAPAISLFVCRQKSIIFCYDRMAGNNLEQGTSYWICALHVFLSLQSYNFFYVLLRVISTF